MIKINAFNSSCSIERFLVKKFVATEAPTLILLAGIHGNEISAFFAIQKLMKRIDELQLQFKGNFYALAGNLQAISKDTRFIDSDLNRLWRTQLINKLQTKNDNFTSEEIEQKELYTIIKELFTQHTGSFYFVDLHTTSSPTTPFITISDSINNRCFSMNFPVPIVLGIEEYIQGPLLTYVNEFGHIGIGFEAGQHQDINAVQINEAFIWMVLVHTGCLTKDEIINYDTYKETLNQLSNFKGQFFEIDYKYAIQKDETFTMNQGYDNFQPIVKDESLANSDLNGLITSPLSGRIFMPLYQAQGDDGFFIITKISHFWLVFSRYVRRMYLHNLLRILPGIKQAPNNKYTLIVSSKMAGILTHKLFHLFGYRRKIKNNDEWLFIKRDRKIVPFS